MGGPVIASSGPLWRVGYDVDFTAQSALNIRTGGNGSKVIDGRTWTWRNDANLATAAVTPGTGIVFTASATNTNYTGATVSSPGLALPLLTGVLAAYSVAAFALRIMVRIQTTNMDANFEGAILALEDSVSPATANVNVKRVYAGGATVEATSTVNNTSVVRKATPADAAKEVLGIVYFDRGAWEQWSGDYDAAEDPAMRLTTPRIGEQVLWTAGMNLNTSPQIFLGQQTGGAAGANLVTTFTHMRVDYALRMNP